MRKEELIELLSLLDLEKFYTINIIKKLASAIKTVSTEYYDLFEEFMKKLPKYCNRSVQIWEKSQVNKINKHLLYYWLFHDAGEEKFKEFMIKWRLGEDISYLYPRK